VRAARPDLCLEFANTLCWRGTAIPSERLHALADVVAWGAEMGCLPPEAARAATGWWDRRKPRAEAAFAEAIALREVLFRLFSATARAAEPRVAEPRAADLAALNRWLAAAPARRRLRRAGADYGWEIEAAPRSVAGLLAGVLWSAGDLLAEPLRLRVRQCANPACQWLFLDDSKSGTRRWCTMRTCGNRAKARRHYHKVRKGS